VNIKLLQSPEQSLLEAFLLPHIETSMFLLSNARNAGLDFSGQLYGCTYLAAIEAGEIVGVVAHAWNGMLLLQAPKFLDELAKEILSLTKRPLSGISGPWSQTQRTIKALGLSSWPVSIGEPEKLYRLELEGLQAPSLLQQEDVNCRRGTLGDVELLMDWRMAYQFELFNSADNEQLRESTRQTLMTNLEHRCMWVLEVQGELVSMMAFNAMLPECVQIGGVYTPSKWRGKHYGRAVVAGSLLDAQKEGRKQAILFTPQQLFSAQACYESLGFQHTGPFGLILFDAPFQAA